MEHLAQRKLTRQSVGCDPGHVADLALDLEPALLGLRRPRQHLIEIPVDEIDNHAVHL